MHAIYHIILCWMDVKGRFDGWTANVAIYRD